MKNLGFLFLFAFFLLFSTKLYAQVATLSPGTGTASAATINGAYTTLTAATFTEGATLAEKLSAGTPAAPTTVIFTPPAGYEFRNSGNTANTPRVQVSNVGGTSGASVSIAFDAANWTTTQIRFNVTGASASTRRNIIVFDRIQIRPIQGDGIGVSLIPNSGTATFGGLSSTATFFQVTKTAAAANKLFFFQQPTSATAGAAITPDIVVEIQDTYGNRTTSTASVTLAIQTNPGGGALNTITAVAAVSGRATFTNRSINAVGTGYVLRASSGALITVDSTAFNILSTSVFDHLRLDYVTSVSTCRGGVTPVVVKACLDAACTTLYTAGTVTGIVAIATTAGTVTPTTQALSFTGGQTSFNISKTDAGTLTLTPTLTSPTAASGPTCFVGGADIDCSTTNAKIVYNLNNSCDFNAVEVGDAPSGRIYTKRASVPFSLDVVATADGAINTGFTGTTFVTLVDESATSGVCTSTVPSNGLQTEQSIVFAAVDAGRKTIPLPFTLATAAKNIRVRVREGTSANCSVDDFTVRPDALSVTTNPTSANGSTAIVAGSGTFTITATAVQTTNVSVAGYTGKPKVDITVLGGSPNLGTLATSPVASTPPTFQTAAAANCSPSCSPVGTFTYNQVGSLSFRNDSTDAGKNSIYDDDWAGNDIANGDCTNNFSNTLVGGKYGCKFGNSSEVTGTNTFTASRFIPSHFGTAPTGAMVCTGLSFSPACPTGGLAYAGQPFTTVITAYLTGGAVASNYTGSNAKAVTLAVCDTVGCTTSPPATFSGALVQPIIAPAVVAGPVPAASFTSGVATITASAVVGSAPSFNFTTTPTAPTNIYLRAVDTDSVTSRNAITPASSIEGGVKVINGRVRILNAYGSELLDLPMSMRAEYWAADSQGWILFPNDRTNVTIQALVPALTCVNEGAATNTSGQACATVSSITSRYFRESPVTTPTDTPNPLFDGNFNLWLRATGTRTSVDVTADVPVWLQYRWRNNVLSNPTGRATFGVVRSGRVIYRQELYR